MPIYEYLCHECNVIFQFLVRDTGTGTDPECPRCSRRGMERVMSTFSTSRKQNDDIPSGMDEEDPKSMARAIRHMADEMGEDLGPELDEAISRLESGENPEDIERDLEKSGFGSPDGSPGRDPGLYEP